MYWPHKKNAKSYRQPRKLCKLFAAEPGKEEDPKNNRR